MAHWAQLDNDNIVIEVLVGDNNDPAGDEGYSWIVRHIGGTWVQASYNTHGGQHANGGTPLRFNYPGKGWLFSDAPEWAAQGGAFIPPQLYPSWTLNPNTALWDAPVPMPTEGGPWAWDEASLSWVEVAA